MRNKQLQLEYVEPVAHAGRHIMIYPRILALSGHSIHTCVLQDIRDFHTNALVGRFVYIPHRGTHRQILTGWQRRLRTSRIAINESRYVRRTSKELCLQQHRGRDVTATPRAIEWYRRVAEGKLRFKRPESTECLELTATVGSSHSPFAAYMTCVLIPMIDTLLVVQTRYDTPSKDLGLVGTRRVWMIERIHHACVHRWRRHSTCDLFT